MFGSERLGNAADYCNALIAVSWAHGNMHG